MKWFMISLLLWFTKTKGNLPAFYHDLSRKQNIAVKDFRNLEKLGFKCVKWNLDIAYFENCEKLKLFPKFLQFKVPRLSAYKDLTSIRKEVLKNQINVLKKEESSIRRRYLKVRYELQARLSFLQFSGLMLKLNDHIKKELEPVQNRHNEKLVKLWYDQRNKSPDCLINKSKRKLNIIYIFSNL